MKAPSPTTEQLRPVWWITVSGYATLFWDGGSWTPSLVSAKYYLTKDEAVEAMVGLSLICELPLILKVGRQAVP